VTDLSIVATDCGCFKGAGLMSVSAWSKVAIHKLV